ncbi:MAG: FtsW/RodA/SpoVE family cell cycle protein, partial [Candidatus Binatia bacterium]
MRDSLAVDRWMLLAVAALLALGLTMVLSTSYLYSQERYADGTYFFRKQMIAMGIGALLLIVCSLLPAAFYRRFAYPLLGISFIILVLVLIPGVGAARGGARRWIMFAGFAFQPSELAKLALIVYLAHSMAKKESMIRTFSVGVLPHLIVAGAFAGVLFLEPDFGSVLILTMLVYFMLFIGGVRVYHLLATGLMALPLLIYVMMKAEYRLRRLLSFLDPWSDAAGSGFHVIQSLIAFGSGQLTGRGLGESRQKLFYLPEAHTDFVYSVIGE